MLQVRCMVYQVLACCHGVIVIIQVLPLCQCHLFKYCDGVIIVYSSIATHGVIYSRIATYGVIYSSIATYGVIYSSIATHGVIFSSIATYGVIVIYLVGI